MKALTFVLAGTALVALAGCNRTADSNIANAANQAAAATQNAAGAVDNAVKAADNAAGAIEASAPAATGDKTPDAGADSSSGPDAPAEPEGDK